MRRFLTAFSNRVLMLDFTVSSSRPARRPLTTDLKDPDAAAEPSYLRVARGRCHRRRAPALGCRGETLPSGSTRLSRLASNRTPECDPGGRGRCWREPPRSSSGPSDLFNDNNIQRRSRGAEIKEPHEPPRLPLASEQTPRNPSSLRYRNKGRTPKVSLPTQTLLLAVSSRMKAKTPSRREAIFWAPKRS